MMKRRCSFAAIAAVFFFVHAPMWAGARLLDIPDRRDHVFDPNTGILYITTARGTVERYDTVAGEMLDPFVCQGTEFNGIDVTPDGSAVYVSDTSGGVNASVVRKFDTATGAYQNLFFRHDGSSGGEWDLSIGTDLDALLINTDDGPGGSIELRILDTETDTQTLSGLSIGSNLQVIRSRDRGTIVTIDIEGSPARLRVYDVATRQFVSISPFSPSVSGLGVGVSPDGSKLVAFASASGSVSLLDRDFNVIMPIQIPDAGPAVFGPLGRLVYIVDRERDELVAVDANTAKELARYDLGEPFFYGPNNSARLDGIMSVTDSGRRVYISTPLGVREVTVDPDVPGVPGKSEGGLPWFWVIALGRRRQKRGGSLRCAIASIALTATGVHAGTRITVTNVRDVVFDDMRRVAYISSADGLVHRYDIERRVLLDPYVVEGRTLQGLDLSPDGNTLFVADREMRAEGVELTAIDLLSGSISTIQFPPYVEPFFPGDQVDIGTVHLICASERLLYATTVTSNSTPIVSLDIVDLTYSFGVEVDQSSTMERSENRGLLSLNGRFGSSLTDMAVYSTGAPFQLSGSHTTLLRSPIVFSRDNALIATGIDPISVMDLFFSPVELIGGGVVSYGFSPGEDILFAADQERHELRGIETHGFVEVECFRLESTSFFSRSPAIEVSEDGRFVFVTTRDGVEWFDTSAPRCIGDCDASGDVSFADLVSMLGAYENLTTCSMCDCDGDGVIRFSDLVCALFQMGPCESAEEPSGLR